jgi:hypothetical protein
VGSFCPGRDRMVRHGARAGVCAADGLTHDSWALDAG